MRTKHGIHVHGFPNVFFVQPTQGANLISNVPHNLTEAGQTIAVIVKHVLDRGRRDVEVTKEAEDAWIELLLSGQGRMLGSRDCTPGYYNNEGQDPGPAARLNVGYPQGATAYFQYLEGWRSAGTSRASSSAERGRIELSAPACMFEIDGPDLRQRTAHAVRRPQGLRQRVSRGRHRSA